MNHILKIKKPYYQAIREGKRNFEIRKNDRGFNAGDTVRLVEIDVDIFVFGPSVTGRECIATIGYVTGEEQQDNNVVFSLINMAFSDDHT